MIVAGDGAIEGLLVSPASLQACMEPLVRTARFPETRLGRQHLSHTVYQPADKVSAPVAPAARVTPEKKPARPAASKPGQAKSPAAKPAPASKP
jgi:hypothetical protein